MMLSCWLERRRQRLTNSYNIIKLTQENADDDIKQAKELPKWECHENSPFPNLESTWKLSTLGKNTRDDLGIERWVEVQQKQSTGDMEYIVGNDIMSTSTVALLRKWSCLQNFSNEVESKVHWWSTSFLLPTWEVEWRCSLVLKSEGHIRKVLLSAWRLLS